MPTDSDFQNIKIEGEELWFSTNKDFFQRYNFDVVKVVYDEV